MEMTIAEWREKMSNCTDRAELDYLLKNKPKGAKSAITSGTHIIATSTTGLPFLEQLSSGKGGSKTK